MYPSAIRQPNQRLGVRRLSYGAKRYSPRRYGGRVIPSIPRNQMTKRKYPRRRKPTASRRRPSTAIKRRL